MDYYIVKISDIKDRTLYELIDVKNQFMNYQLDYYHL